MSPNLQRVEQEEPRRPLAQTVTPADLLRMAVEGGADLDRLERLMALKDQWDRGEARKAYMEAIAAFKANPPDVMKDKKNNQYNSYYTTLANLVNTVNASLAPHGLSANWDIKQDDKVTVTCVLSHVMGHSERVSMTGPLDTSGSKNVLQQIKSTVTYLRGATFEAVTGIASREFNADDDGNSAGPQNYDITGWCDAFKDASTHDELHQLGEKLKAEKGIPANAMRNLRAAYAKRAKELA